LLLNYHKLEPNFAQSRPLTLQPKAGQVQTGLAGATTQNQFESGTLRPLFENETNIFHECHLLDCIKVDNKKK
jgi:hypothetical protein